MLEGFKINCYPLNRTIRVSVHLPKDYNSTNRFYPVLYFLDGQNLYSDQDSYRGVALDLESTIMQLSDVGKDAIFIGIAAASNPQMRESEYKNTILADFILKSIHPYLSSRYRLNSFLYVVACSTAAYTALRLIQSEAFKGMYLISPLLPTTMEEHPFPNNKLYYIYYGENELNKKVKQTALDLKKYLPEVQIIFDQNEIHNESYWRKMLLPVLNDFVL